MDRSADWLNQAKRDLGKVGFPQGMPADYFDHKIAAEALDAVRKIAGFCENSIR